LHEFNEGVISIALQLPADSPDFLLLERLLAQGTKAFSFQLVVEIISSNIHLHPLELLNEAVLAQLCEINRLQLAIFVDIHERFKGATASDEKINSFDFHFAKLN